MLADAFELMEVCPVAFSQNIQFNIRMLIESDWETKSTEKWRNSMANFTDKVKCWDTQSFYLHSLALIASGI